MSFFLLCKMLNKWYTKLRPCWRVIVKKWLTKYKGFNIIAVKLLNNTGDNVQEFKGQMKQPWLLLEQSLNHLPIKGRQAITEPVVCTCSAPGSKCSQTLPWTALTLKVSQLLSEAPSHSSILLLYAAPPISPHPISCLWWFNASSPLSLPLTPSCIPPPSPHPLSAWWSQSAVQV